VDVLKKIEGFCLDAFLGSTMIGGWFFLLTCAYLFFLGLAALAMSCAVATSPIWVPIYLWRTRRKENLNLGG
jgi:hypothetical protein